MVVGWPKKRPAMAEILNRERFLVAALRQLCAEQNIRCDSFCHDWVLRLERQGRVSHVVGFHFEIGPATAPLLATDKAATSTLLAAAGLPHVEHHLLLHPREASYVGVAGNWSEALRWAEAHGLQVVVKPNEGTGGHDVIRVTSVLELEKAVHRLFESHRALALSPWLAVEAEYRVVLLAGEPLLVYSKERPAVVGDGQSSLGALVLSQRGPAGLEGAEIQPGGWSRVPAAGEVIRLRWRHNLGAGATPSDLAAGPENEAVTALARQAAQTLGIELASVDLVAAAGELRVLELNSGIMLESYARHSVAGARRARDIYGKILRHIFG